MNIPRSSCEQDDIVNSLNYGALRGEVAVLPLSLTVTDCVLALSQTSFE